MFVWLVFLGATFMTQVVFFNLLIAIMGDTFDRVQEIRDQSTYAEKCGIMAEYLWIVDLDAAVGDDRYIFIVDKDTVDGAGQQNWEGKIAKLTKTF
mmetsp:Transcript_17314/g.12311  ORF Transcript_17314/g.12311 Transcript_17314/m.12311 type:complete len:96 (+) Transcript_17314:5218-5505(+)